jgi:photosystem II stability/assembly factor-like uncharacterized protein
MKSIKIKMWQKSLISFIVSFFFAAGVSYSQDWQIIKTFQPTQTLHSIRFANENVGYTVSTLYNGSTFNIHKTEDGGETWIDQSSGHTSTRFKDMHVFSEDTVMMCGNFGIVITTFDGGETWTTDTVSENGDHFFGISFVGHTGYVAGNSGAIYKTTDLGENWQVVDPPIVSAISEVYFLTEDYGFVCGLNFIYYTTDGGQSWIEPETFPGATTNWWLREMDFINDSVGFVSGDIGQIYKTTDAGKNWTSIENTGTGESLQSIVAMNEDELYACGFAGVVIHTNDGGNSWEMMSTAVTENLYSMAFPTPEKGYVCSHSGKVLSYEDPSVFIPVVNPDPDLSIYPNPASGSFKVKSDRQISSIEIFTITGEKVMSRAVKSFEKVIDVTGLKHNVYMLKIETASGVMYEKLVVK